MLVNLRSRLYDPTTFSLSYLIHDVKCTAKTHHVFVIKFVVLVHVLFNASTTLFRICDSIIIFSIKSWLFIFSSIFCLSFALIALLLFLVLLSICTTFLACCASFCRIVSLSTWCIIFFLNDICNVNIIIPDRLAILIDILAEGRTLGTEQ